MKRLLIPLLAAIALPNAVSAEKLCTITSELDKDVVIKIDGEYLGMFGRITYKDKSMYRISFFHQNGYGGHRYTISEDKDPDISWEDFKHEKYPGSGLAVFFVGNQVAKGTPVEERKKGQKRMLMPQLGSNIWYGRMWFDDRKEPDNLKVISAAEGFFKIEGKKCRFPYMW
tara:strand:- start:99 stop:611 length:513 start_codon:yes stop_codon:yes gene_type:complete